MTRWTPPPFRPAPGLANPHVQTIAGKLLRPDLGLPLWRERLETPDGDFVDLDFAFDPDDRAQPDAPVVVLLHGLEGSARRRYMQHTYRGLLGRGLRPLGLNFRGCSGEPNRTARAYHSGETGDLRLVLDTLAARYPDAPRAVVGYSLGGNVVLKFLGEEGGTVGSGPETCARVAAGAAVSVPFDLAAGARALEDSRIGRAIYTRYFMRTLVPKTLARSDVLPRTVDLARVRRARTIREFDDAVTAPLHGFDSAADYYARSSSAGFLADIAVPTLVVHSRDDPFLPASAIPESALEANPAITAVLTDRGGHQGYVAGTIVRPEFWVEGVVAEWLGPLLRQG
ncbi:MAG: hydrolase [Longimicrobiales bacterium]|nr:hydrolase [Longimicrobiales bacterium]